MPRPPRIQYANAIYHIIAKGNRGQRIFLDDADREKYLSYLKAARRRFGLEIFCFALLDNHFHISLRTPSPNLSTAIRWLLTSYSVYFSVRHKQGGHLFAGRFKSILVEDESYLVTLSYYVHLNPVKAGLVKDPRAYRWSTCRAYTEPKAGDSWLRTDVVLSQLSLEPKKQKRLYRRGLKESTEEARRIDKTVRRGFLLGCNEFKTKICNKFVIERQGGNRLGVPLSPGKILEAVAKHFRCSREELLSVGKGRVNMHRDDAIYLMRELAFLQREEIGRLFGIGFKAVEKSIERTRAKISRNQVTKDEIDGIRKELGV